MFELLRARIRHGHRTIALPVAGDALPARFRGRPSLSPERCRDECRACADACPTRAITTAPLRIDLGACLFCPGCAEACPDGAIEFTPDHCLAATSRAALVVGAGDEDRDRAASLATALDRASKRLFGRALRLRQVSAGGCNGCEAELAALSNVVFDIGRFGVQFVASPRHADGVLVTGPVSQNMRQALFETHEAIPSPRIVIASGACAISGGPFAGADATSNGIPQELPVDLFIPGCPPHPLTVMDGLLRLLGRIE